MARQKTDYEALWRSIEQAGNVDAYVESQLRELGYLVERRETDGMSQRELSAYKKSLKAEAAEKRKLKSEAWQAYRQKHIVHLGEGIYWNDQDDFDRWDLDEPEKRAAENELPPIDKPAQLAQMMGLTIPQLRWLAYHRDAATHVHYRRFTIPKRDGSDREIWAPLPILKEAQRWILRNIVEKLLVHGAAHGFLPGRSIVSNAAVHVDSRIVMKMDLRNFFPTVNYRRVKGVFRKAGYREQIATLLALICTESPREVVNSNGKTYYVSLGPRSLPQGAPTSPGLTNAICLKLDGRLSGLAEKYGWRKKTSVLRSGSSQRVTGMVVNGDGSPRAKRAVRRNLRAAIHNLKQGKPLKDGESIDTLRGMAAFVSMSDRELGVKFRDEIEALSKSVD